MLKTTVEFAGRPFNSVKLQKWKYLNRVSSADNV